MAQYIPGDYYVQCDLSGQKTLRSQCVKQWNGLIVKKEYAEVRHPLDLQRPPRVERVIKESRSVNEIELNYGDVTAEDL